MQNIHNRYKCDKCGCAEKLDHINTLKIIVAHFKEPFIVLKNNLDNDWEQIWACYQEMIDIRNLFDAHPCEKIQLGLKHLFNNTLQKMFLTLKLCEFYTDWKRDIIITIDNTNAQIENISNYEDIFIFNEKGFGDFADLTYPAQALRQVVVSKKPR